MTRVMRWSTAVVVGGLFALVGVGLAGSDRTDAVQGIVWAEGKGIYGARPDGTAIHRITAFDRVSPRDFASDGFNSPVWTRDGQALAYTGQLSDSTFIFVVSPRTGTARFVGFGDVAWNPSWSPDGERMAFADGWFYRCGGYDCWGGTTIGIGAVDAGAGRPKTVTVRKRHRFDVSPAWSPDGRTIAFVRRTPTGSGVYLVGADGKGLRPLTGGSAPSWSPDSGRLVVESSGHLFTIEVSGGRRVRIGAGSDPSWSPDGRKILFLHGTPDPSIWVMNTDGSNRVRLVRGRNRDVRSPGWQPG